MKIYLAGIHKINVALRLYGKMADHGDFKKLSPQNLKYNLVSGVPGIGNLVVTIHSGTLNLNNNVDILC